MATNERTPLIVTIQIAPPRKRYQHGVRRRFYVVAIRSSIIATIIATIIWEIASILQRPRPATDTQTCYSSLGTSRAYASAEALSNNIDDFCQDVTNNILLVTISRTWSKTYYPNTPEEYKMTVALSNRAFGFDHSHCTVFMSSIIDYCDVPVVESNPMNWKQGGKRIQGEYTYQIDISRQNRLWPPPTKPMQSCEGWYKFILHHYDIYGAGWANYDWGQYSLLPAINPCCGLGSLTGWNFEYFDQPDENGYEWHAWFNTALGTRGRCFDNNIVQCTAGGPCDSYCSG
ncbi:hypothetical protein BJ170DRAFT_646582, partial [Xylariales sp. AK1849]